MLFAIRHTVYFKFVSLWSFVYYKQSILIMFSTVDIVFIYDGNVCNVFKNSELYVIFYVKFLIIGHNDIICGK